MPKLLKAKPARRRHSTAARKNATKPRKKALTAYQVVRGTAPNPTPMLLQSSKKAAQKAAAWLRSHFPGHKIRVIKAPK